MTPSTKSWLRLFAIIGVVILAVWGGLRWRAAVALQARIEAVGYYRVGAAYTVKDTGERIAFDYVAACATVVTMYRDGDRSVDTPFGIAPKMVFAATRDGHAIQLVTPDACHHEAKEGDIAPDLIPLTIWHDDVNDLHFGCGYTSAVGPAAVRIATKAQGGRPTIPRPAARSRRPVSVPGAPRCALHQQYLRARLATASDLPQGHSMLSSRVGRRGLRRSRQCHRNRAVARRNRTRSVDRRAARTARYANRVTGG